MRQSEERHSWREQVGILAGWMAAPLTGAGSLLRHARLFHPEGAVFRARVEPDEGTPYAATARRLSGPALARLSTAWWRRGRELPDALGLALRLRDRDEPSTVAEPGDQDLLFATIRHPLTTLLAPLSTQVHDFLANDYYGVSPFVIEGIGRAWLRAVSPRPASAGQDRGERLLAAVATGQARFVLEVQRGRFSPWEPL